tara:strand:- start:787 stop:1290 length:504 start_codon:yes stop_codon:yes gene_type:complete
MISKRLKSRFKFIKGTPLANRAKTSVFSRRGKNHVIIEDEDSELEKYDTFFEYEQDLAELKPSGEQYMEMISPDPFVTMEDKEDAIEKSVATIAMEEKVDLEPIEMEEVAELVVNSQENNTYTDVVGFEFVQCEFTKTDGNRCKRQAPKGGVICSTHKRYIEKHGAN